MTAVIAAAGSGERLGAGGPKAFLPLAGRPMVEWSINAFGVAGVAAIVVAMPPELASSHLPDAPQVGPGDGSTVVVAGGATRAESVSNAIRAVETEVVAIHDAARPLVTPELIEGVVATLEADPDAAGAIAACPVTDTIKRAGATLGPTSAPLTPQYGANGARVVDSTLDRSALWAAQTPQVFRVDALREAISAASADELAAATDEATLVEANGGRVLIHPAPAENVKVTTPLDLRLAELLLAERSGA